MLLGISHLSQSQRPSQHGFSLLGMAGSFQGIQLLQLLNLSIGHHQFNESQTESLIPSQEAMCVPPIYSQNMNLANAKWNHPLLTRDICSKLEHQSI